MLLDAEGGSPGGTLNRALEALVAERLDLPAVTADEVVMVVAARLRRLVARAAGTQVEPVDETEPGQRLERAIHAGDTDARAPPPHFVVDLARGQAALLVREDVDDGAARAARLEACVAKGALRVLRPGHGRGMIPVLILMYARSA